MKALNYFFSLILIFIGFTAITAQAAETALVEKPSCYIYANGMVYGNVPLGFKDFWSYTGLADGTLVLTTNETGQFVSPTHEEDFYGLRNVEVNIEEGFMVVDFHSDYGVFSEVVPFVIQYGNLLQFKGFPEKARMTQFVARKSYEIKTREPQVGDEGIKYTFLCTSETWFTNQQGENLEK